MKVIVMKWKQWFRSKYLRICGYDYQLQFGSRINSEEDTLGETDFSRQLIRLGRGMGDEQALSTLLHEALHVIDHALQLDLQEVGVRRMEAALHQLLKDNPGLCAAYLDLAAESRKRFEVTSS